MKIKKLAIHGFKSFSERTEMHFPAGTSAIVGPNGCGKSNIVDAIRWVIGEQNARHLRGKLMEDLIFSGTEARKPIGMAEVTLTLSNESGTAPVSYANFPEIEIQRRLYRSGESEYSINKVPSRLKDIIDFFGDTGIGREAYSIIEQGQVGWLITAKPEERRSIFEEAAGINKYKHKKDAALRRLDATKQNLLRVGDIMAEVKRQLNSLNRQAKKAERYKVFKDELKKLDLYLMYLQLKAMFDKRSLAEKAINESEDREIFLAADLSGRETLLQEINVGYLEKETEFNALREKGFELESRVQAEERAVELARLRSDELKRTIDRLASDIGELNGHKVVSEKELEGLRLELAKVIDAIDDNRVRLSRKEDEVSAINRVLAEKELALKAGETSFMESNAKIANAKHLMQSHIREEETLRARRTKFEVESADTLKAMEGKAALFEALKERIVALLKRKEEGEAEFKVLEKRRIAFEAERSSKTEDFNRASAELASKNARLTTLEEMERGMAGIKDGVRAVMGNGSGISVKGLIADAIETTRGFERAVEAVLGERLQYVLVESQADGLRAVEYLKSGSGGRGSFVPLNDMRLYEDSSSPSPSGAKFLRDEVSVKDDYKGLIACLIGDALVVDNLAAALDMWRSNGARKTIVTMDGETIDPQGVITGGALNGSEANILLKRREIKDLSSEASSLETSSKSLSEGLKRLDSELSGLKADIENYRKRLYSDDIEKANMEGEIQRAGDELERLKEKAAGLSSELRLADESLSSIAVKKAELLKEREELEADIASKELRIKELFEETKSLKQKKDSMSDDLSAIKVVLASLEERKSNISSQSVDKAAVISGMEKRIESKNLETASSSVEIEAKREEELSHKELLEGLLVSKDALRKDFVQREEELASASAEIKRLESEVKSLNFELSKVKEARTSVTLELREIDLSSANMREKSIERYGTDITAYAPAEDVLAMERETLDAAVIELREKLGAMGEVSLSALEEYAELEKRHDFLAVQQDDLNKSVESLHSAITRINRTTRELFQKTFDEVNAKFSETFPKFFTGGRAELRITGEGDVLECGVDIVAQPPGKKLQNINLLSGGEKALTATALIFAIFLIKPAPFCLLDEVDAPLDDVNVDRFNGFVKEMSGHSQFILITHNKRTMEMADTLFGITMPEPGASKVVTVAL
ncbi:MAG: chromosome segregation protein SMC [Thermodesulfobacteriota bacterium]